MPDALDRLTKQMVAAWSWGLPDWEGNVMDVGIFTPGQHGVARPVPWEAVASARAPGLPGDGLRFAVSDDRDVIAEPDVPVDALTPLANALTEELEPPFCAVAVRDEGDVWATAASRAQIIDVQHAKGREIEISRVNGAIKTRVDRRDTDRRFVGLEALLDREHGDATVLAHRFTGTTWVADVFPL